MPKFHRIYSSYIGKIWIFLEFGIINFENGILLLKFEFFNHIWAFKFNLVHFTFLSVLAKLDGIHDSDLASILLCYSKGDFHWILILDTSSIFSILKARIFVGLNL